MTTPRIFDAHVHVHQGLAAYDLEVTGKNIIFNDVASYREHHARYRSEGTTVSLVLDLGREADFVRSEAEAGGLAALKIHSRLQKITATGWDAVITRLRPMPPNLPVIVDAFYYGSNLDCQPSLNGIISLLSTFPERRFVVAHSGGHRILEYFFHLREFRNCWYELALSLQYLEDSSALLDLKKLIKFTDKSRILFGSDFPFASPRRQYKILLEIGKALALTSEDMDRILYANAAELLGTT
ncbi:MAG TPA: amidohydrolase family protein [Candidatus Baltobacteraceae bacterium]|nr:amidohydrolase family protein [Candidatus Baltobacteraceae bacterium]